MRRECHLILMFGLIILCSTLQGCGYSDVEEKAVAIEESSTETDKPSDETPTDTGSEENDAEKIRDGYYGFQADDGTRYSLGINIEGFQDYFMLSVLPVNGGGVVIEGSIKDNGDGTYIARVNNNNSDGLSDKGQGRALRQDKQTCRRAYRRRSHRRSKETYRNGSDRRRYLNEGHRIQRDHRIS